MKNTYLWRQNALIRIKIIDKDNNKDNICKNGSNTDYIALSNAITEVQDLVGKCKDNYHNQLAKKLSNPKNSFKT